MVFDSEQSMRMLPAEKCILGNLVWDFDPWTHDFN